MRSAGVLVSNDQNRHVFEPIDEKGRVSEREIILYPFFRDRVS